jgi:hypothetical protein
MAGYGTGWNEFTPETAGIFFGLHQHNEEAANILNILFALIEQIDPSKKSLI